VELTLNEKRLLVALKETNSSDPETIAEYLNTTKDAVVQFAHLCDEKGLVTLKEDITSTCHLTEEGEEYKVSGLPERQVIDSFETKIAMKDLRKHPLAKIAIGWMRRKGWIAINAGIVEKTEKISPGEDELSLQSLTGPGIPELIKRGLVKEEEKVTRTITITQKGMALTDAGLNLREETGRLTREEIISGEWKELSLRKYSVHKLPKTVFAGKKHPYQELIDEMRRVLLEMGFTEMSGSIIQSSFWNFDALFQPQDHPAREMQDTFFLDLQEELPKDFRAVQEIHESGGDTSSTGWGGEWKREKAEECVLRTHTTCLSIQHLKENPEPPVKAFCIGRVYRRETIDPTHTPEFEQLEGIVMDKDVSFRHLMGFLKEFYRRMGFENVRFRPAYFPYTEPSVEPEVYVNGLGWVELGGAGIFREEVTSPLGVKYPVLAWGLGVSRVAMLKMGLKDLRELYRSDIDWVRNSPIYHKGSNKEQQE